MFDPDDPQALAARREAYRRMTPSERWRVACEMHDFAWVAKLSSVRHDHPDWNEEQVKAKVREIFLYAAT
jgi:hypothetical protein